MNACVGFLCILCFVYSFGNSLGYFNWNVQSRAVVCSGDNADLVWDYTTNETASNVLWEKLGSTNALVSRIFGGQFNVHPAYSGRVNQTNLGKAAITITSVTSLDNGTYRCTIQSVNRQNISLIVTETPSGLPYFNKTDTSLTCNPPQNLGTPPVQTTLKLQGGVINPILTTTQGGTHQCCISGDAVRCLSSTSNTATEVCVNETLGSTGPTTEPPPQCTCSVLPCVGESDFCVLWIILIAVGVFVVICVVCCILCVVRKRHKEKDKNEIKMKRQR